MAELQKTYPATVKNDHPAVITPKDSKSVSWGTFGDGACTLYAAALTFNSDGTAAFGGDISGNIPPPSASVITIQGFGLHDANGLELYRTPSFQLGGNYDQALGFLVEVLYPAYMYPYITTVVLYT
jgi:hypothetical protein